MIAVAVNVLPVEPNWNKRVLVDRQRVLDAGHAVEGVVLLAGVENADGHAWHGEALGRRGDPFLQGRLISSHAPLSLSRVRPHLVRAAEVGRPHLSGTRTAVGFVPLT